MSAPVDPALRQAAQGLEAMLLRQMIGAMRAGSVGDALTGSNAQNQFRDMLDARLADTIAAQGDGIGLADQIARQLGGAAR